MFLKLEKYSLKFYKVLSTMFLSDEFTYKVLYVSCSNE